MQIAPMISPALSPVSLSEIQETTPAAARMAEVPRPPLEAAIGTLDHLIDVTGKVLLRLFSRDVVSSPETRGDLVTSLLSSLESMVKKGSLLGRILEGVRTLFPGSSMRDLPLSGKI